jgi:hypothetical protein
MYAYEAYPGNGATTQFTIPFPYIAQEHVEVYIDAVLQTLGSDYTYLNSSTVLFTVAPDNGTTIGIQRNTPKDSRIVDFQDAAILTEAALDQDSNQLMYIAQEGYDVAEGSLKVAVDNTFDVGGRRVSNLGAAVDPTDAVTKGYADTILISTQGYATNAAASAAAALISENNAAASEDAAALSESAAAGYAASINPSSFQPVDATLTAIADESIGAFSHRNKIINGNFGINQRAVSGTVVLAAGQYGHDRWKAGAGGCTYTFATSANVTTLTITAGTLMQVIEGENLLSGTHVLTWTGTATARVDSGSYGASGLTGTATGGTTQTIEFATGTVSKVQYEPGSVPSPFEHRPYGTELVLCQRYYETGGIYGFGYAATGGVGRAARVTHSVSKRANPTVTLSSLTYGNASAATTSTILIDGFGINVSVSAAGVYSVTGNWTASAEL